MFTSIYNKACAYSQDIVKCLFVCVCVLSNKFLFLPTTTDTGFKIARTRKRIK